MNNNNTTQYIVLILIGCIAWLQYNLGFYAAIAAVVLLAVIIIFSLAIHHQKSVSDSLVQHKMADARVELERMRILRQSLIAEHRTETRAAQMAMLLTRHGIGAVKAQMDAKYASKLAQVRQTQLSAPVDEEEEFNPYDETIDADYTVDPTSW